MALLTPQIHRWTQEQYYRMAELGFFRGQRVQLIQGEIIAMPPMKNPHAIALGLVEDSLEKAFGPTCWVRTQLPLNLTKYSVPEPDVAVVSGRPRDFADHPTSALLIVEISDTTLRFDRGRKARLYAAANIADYWIVNLVDSQVEIYRQPQPDPVQARRKVYADVRIHQAGDLLRPLAAPHAQILVDDLLP